MAITDKLTAIADSMREADGSSRTYNMVEMAERPAVWQQTIAEAITAKGVDTLPDSSFDVMAANIGLISGGGSGDYAVLFKPVVLSSDASAKLTLASKQELIDAGIIDNESEKIGDNWRDVFIQFIAGSASPSCIITANYFSGKFPFSTSSYRFNTLRSSSNQTMYTADTGLDAASVGQLEENSSGIQIYCNSSRKVQRGTHSVLIFVSSRK